MSQQINYIKNDIKKYNICKRETNFHGGKESDIFKIRYTLEKYTHKAM